MNINDHECVYYKMENLNNLFLQKIVYALKIYLGTVQTIFSFKANQYDKSTLFKCYHVSLRI